MYSIALKIDKIVDPQRFVKPSDQCLDINACSAPHLFPSHVTRKVIFAKHVELQTFRKQLCEKLSPALL